MKAFLISLFLIYSTTPVSASTKDFVYNNGQCINAQGQTGYNHVDTTVVSPIIERSVPTLFGYFGGTGVTYNFIEKIDGECVDFSTLESFSERYFPGNGRRIWIENLNLKGAIGLTATNAPFDFDCPRAMFEGAQIDERIIFYSMIAATIDEFSSLQNCHDIKIKKGEWADSVVDNNTEFCSTTNFP